MRVSKLELYYLAFSFPCAIPGFFELGERTQNKMIVLMLLLWVPGVLYALYLIKNHYGAYENQARTAFGHGEKRTTKK